MDMNGNEKNYTYLLSFLVFKKKGRFSLACSLLCCAGIPGGLHYRSIKPLFPPLWRSPVIIYTKKEYPVFVDELIQLHDHISVSAGVRGTQMLLAPDDYLRATKAAVGPISRSE